MPRTLPASYSCRDLKVSIVYSWRAKAHGERKTKEESRGLKVAARFDGRATSLLPPFNLSVDGNACGDCIMCFPAQLRIPAGVGCLVKTSAHYLKRNENYESQIARQDSCARIKSHKRVQLQPSSSHPAYMSSHVMRYLLYSGAMRLITGSNEKTKQWFLDCSDASREQPDKPLQRVPTRAAL